VDLKKRLVHTAAVAVKDIVHPAKCVMVKALTMLMNLNLQNVPTVMALDSGIVLHVQFVEVLGGCSVA